MGTTSEVGAKGALARRPSDEVDQLVRLAAVGDATAWKELIEEFDGMIAAIARAHDLPDADAADIAQTAWLRLAENLDLLQDPPRVGTWLATTARRECLRTMRASARELPVEQPSDATQRDLASVDSHLLHAQRDATLFSAFSRFSHRDQALLRLFMSEPRQTPL